MSIYLQVLTYLVPICTIVNNIVLYMEKIVIDFFVDGMKMVRTQYNENNI